MKLLNKNWVVAAVFAIVIFQVAFFSKPANAQLKSLVGVTSCTAGGAAGQLIGNGLSQYIDNKLASLTNKLPDRLSEFLGIKDKVTRSLMTVPVNDSKTQEKITNFNRNWVSKESRLDIIARCVARETTDKMIGNTLNVIRNHGRDGGASFVKNWRNFATGGEYRGENLFRLMLSNTSLCDHFNQGLKGVFRALTPTNIRGQNTRAGDFDPYQLKADCTMPAGWSLNEYQKDFEENGGWLAFAKLTEPQNNILGSFTMALGEASKQRNLEREIDLAEAESSGGYTSRRGRGGTESCLVKGANSQCVVYKDILTPGSTLQGSVAATVQQEIAWVTNADELGEVITAFTSQLLNRVLDLGNNNEARPIDPADLPTYNPVNPGADLPEPPPDGLPGPIEEVPPGNDNPSPNGDSAYISGYVYQDSNGDGARDSDEPLISGSTVHLQTENGTTDITTSQTFQGIYTFGQLEDGKQYRVTHPVPNNYIRTTDDSLVVTATSGGTSQDFGIKPK